MQALEYVLAVGIYVRHADALADMRDLTNPGPVAEALAGVAVVTRGLTGSVMEQGGGGTTGYGIGTGAAAGVVAGVLVAAPSVVAAPFVGAAAGAVIGGLVGHHLKVQETEHLVALLGDDLPVGASALAAVLPAAFLGEVRAAMHRASRTTGRVLADDATRRLARGLVRGNPQATEALADGDA